MWTYGSVQEDLGTQGEGWDPIVGIVDDEDVDGSINNNTDVLIVARRESWWFVYSQDSFVNAKR